MKRATISLPSDLSRAVDDYIQSQEVRPALTAVVQTALREYLSARGFLRARRRLKISAHGNSGVRDVSINHDYYFARDSRKVSKSAAPATRSTSSRASRNRT